MNNYIERLAGLDTPTVSDALDKHGLVGAVYGLAPLTIQKRIVGRATTVKLGPPQESAPKRHLGAGAIMAASRGDVIIVEHQRSDVSGWGGLLTRGAMVKGLAGVVIDGAFRDVDEARELGFPIFGRAAVPITARGRIAEHAFNEPVTISGVTVCPGDFVMADCSGVVFIPAARIEEVLVEAERIFRIEQLMASRIESGIPIGEVMGTNYEDMLKQPEHANE